MIYIYKHRNLINGKVYIGQTSNTKDRWMPSRYKNSPVFYRAIQKYGWDNFTHEILSEIEDQREADNQEIALIAYFDSTNPEKGYNISYGGNSPTRGRGHLISGINSPNYGKKLSELTKKKISASRKGKCIGKENGKRKAVYLIDTINGWDEYYPSIRDLNKAYSEWNYDTIKKALLKNSLFKKRYRIEYAEEVADEIW